MASAYRRSLQKLFKQATIEAVQFLLLLLVSLCLVAQPPAPDASDITKPTQADLVVGTRVARDMVW
jgi:hypothetical protein